MVALHCYYCHRPVSLDDHANVQRAIELVLGQNCDNGVHDYMVSNTFVYTDLVVCPADFVREIAENYEVLAEEARETKEANA